MHCYAVTSFQYLKVPLSHKALFYKHNDDEKANYAVNSESLSIMPSKLNCLRHGGEWHTVVDCPMHRHNKGHLNFNLLTNSGFLS